MADLSSPFTASGLAPGFGNQLAALDSVGNLWVANQDASISAFTNAGAPLGSTPYNTGTSAQPSALTIDGQNNLWEIVSIFDSGTLTNTSYLLGFNSAGAPLLGASGHPLPSTTNNIAIDGSGNIWISTSNSVTEILGAATPVVTPLSAAVATNTIATRP